MPGRTYSSDAYRYGFNGKEKDDKGEWGQTHYDYGFRIYNPSIAKFLSVDPLTGSYPWYTPYQFAGNKPIRFIDLDGLEEYDPMTGNNADFGLASGLNSFINLLILQGIPGYEYKLRKEEFAKIGITDEETIEKFQLRKKLIPAGDPYPDFKNFSSIDGKIPMAQRYVSILVLEPKKSKWENAIENYSDALVVYSVASGFSNGGTTAGSMPQVFMARGGNIIAVSKINSIIELGTETISNIYQKGKQISIDAKVLENLGFPGQMKYNSAIKSLKEGGEFVAKSREEAEQILKNAGIDNPIFENPELILDKIGENTNGHFGPHINYNYNGNIGTITIQ